MVIWKYKLPFIFKELISIPMPKYSTILSVREQDKQICVWALINSIDSQRKTEDRQFQILMTGQPLGDDTAIGSFLGTVQIEELVFHVFTFTPDW